jgi:hypothetical protein
MNQIRVLSLTSFLTSSLLVGPSSHATPVGLPEGFEAELFSRGEGDFDLVGPGGFAINLSAAPHRIEVQEPNGNGQSGDSLYSIPLSGPSMGVVRRLAEPPAPFATCTIGDVAVDDVGRVYVSNVSAQDLMVVTPEGQSFSVPLGGNGGGGSCTNSLAMGLAFVPSLRSLLVASPADGSLGLLDLDDPGSPLVQLGGGLGIPLAMTYDEPRRRLVILDATPGRSRLLEIPLETLFAGAQPGVLHTLPANIAPTFGIAVDPAGGLYLAAQGSGAIGSAGAILRFPPNANPPTLFACTDTRIPLKLAFGPGSDNREGPSLYLNWVPTAANFTTHDPDEDGFIEIRGPFTEEPLASARPEDCLLHDLELNPVLQYEFEDPPGLAVRNSGRFTGAAGTLKNFENPGAGPVRTFDIPPPFEKGSAFAFDGSGDNIQIQNDTDYTTTGAAGAALLESLTIEAWVKPGPTDISRQQAIWEDFGNPGVFFGINSARVQLTLSTELNPGPGTTLIAGFVEAGSWQHIAAVYDGGEIRIFVNGRQACETRTTSGGIIANFADQPIRIGTDNLQPQFLGYEGLLDDLRIHDRALSPQELARGWFRLVGRDDGDPDLDGLNSSCDACPEDPKKTTPGECGCGIDDLDTDEDGLYDCLDLCPEVAAGNNDSPPLGDVSAGWQLDLIGSLSFAKAFAVVPESSPFEPGFIFSTMGDYESPDELWHMSPDGRLSALAPPLTETDPIGLEFAPSGLRDAFGSWLYIVANNRDGFIPGDCGGAIMRFDGTRYEDLTPLQSSTPCYANFSQTAMSEPIALAFVHEPPSIFVTNGVDVPDDLYRVTPDGAVLALASDGRTSTGWHLANIAAPRSGSAWKLPIAIDRGVTCGGCLRELGGDPPIGRSFLPHQATAITFGGPAFGDSLLMAEGDVVSRVTLQGTRDVLVKGIGDIRGDALETSEDGNILYILTGNRLLALSRASQTDSDGDGVGDGCDECPEDPSKSAAGECGCGHPERDCSALTSACTVGRCDADTGSCVAVPVEDGSRCDDGINCTVADKCDGGQCVGQAVDCSDFDSACTKASCRESDGACVEVAANEGEPCDDGLLCTLNDICSSGRCGGMRVDCSASDSACTAGTCEPATGACVAAPANENAACEDGDPCTVGEVCDDGACGGSPKDCSGLDEACVVGICDGKSGECVAIPRVDETLCDDGDPCTVEDRCEVGRCVGVEKDCSVEDGACTVGACVDGTCLANPREDGLACDDADPCTEGGSCESGACIAPQKDCSALDGPCVTGVCNEAGACVAAPVTSVEACDDGDPCTEADTCIDGRCEGAEVDCENQSDGLCANLTCNPTRDGDGDGVADVDDEAAEDPTICRDLDRDTCSDCARTGANGSGGNVDDDGPDGDQDGLCDLVDPVDPTSPVDPTEGDSESSTASSGCGCRGGVDPTSLVAMFGALAFLLRARMRSK